MAELEFHKVNKIFDGEVHAVRDLSLKIRDGEFVVMVGPSGCGKSTVLRLAAGLETVSDGDIRIGGDSVNHLSPQERNIAMVFQNYALYPHKTARKNLLFPLKMMKLDQQEIEKRIEKASRLLGLHDYLERKPGQLSGGERQRVAMGRAIVRDPQVFLMDEPLSNLDAKLRVEIRGQIAELQRRIGITALYVTHDQVEAMTLGDRVAVIKDGELQQVGTAREIYDAPVNVFVATFIGSPRMNIFHSRIERADEGYTVMFGDHRLPLDADEVDSNRKLQQQLGEPILAGLRPEAVTRADDDESGDRLIDVKVMNTEMLGHELIVYFESEAELYSEDDDPDSPREEEGRHWDSAMVARLPADIRPGKEEKITLCFDTSKLRFFTTDGGALYPD